MSIEETAEQISKMDALLQRLSSSHTSYIKLKDDYMKIVAGLRGEKELARQLKRLPQDGFVVLAGARLFQDGIPFQMDGLILSPKLIIIVESKNMFGTLFFDTEFNQMIRLANDVEEGYRNPITQVSFHKEQLQKWLFINGFGHPPIETLVSISHPSTILKTNAANQSQIFSQVMHAENIVGAIIQLQDKYDQTYLNVGEISALIERFHTPVDLNLLEKYEIKVKDLLTGVHCPNCKSLPMKRVYGKWLCPSCSSFSKDAHVKAIRDYLLLIQPTISNKQCRDFLHLKSANIAQLMLRSMGLRAEGETKSRVYRIAE
ncbi:NERD domain-containing protein [Aquibacillus koreensis]|uniref:NERD domain-containing protein n=1 Tax=Aquibacillus koreensis TaxID=279446 RepID=A0A9X3WIT2_9BACI|nr:nuclease-related domain-containing protein [Aquibacillus koreensis]MCT2535085.1 NERD domain-containing protein [Aquibacillus koreensis]MDC3419728.1 NERD domain-containing protein [Aquibacillus koreensis]